MPANVVVKLLTVARAVVRAIAAVVVIVVVATAAAATVEGVPAQPGCRFES